MSCELCGKKDAPMRAKVEGVEMQVCETCSAYGTVVKRTPPVVKSESHAHAPHRSHAPEITERVDPRTPAVLRAYREKHRLTQEEFAQRLRIRLSTYHHYETGSVLPNITDARSIEKAIGAHLVLKERITGETAHTPTASQGMSLGDFIKR